MTLFQRKKNSSSTISKNHTKQGDAVEEQAWEFLLKQGMTPIERNYHCRYGEIDLITLDKNIVVFTEVRLRSNPKWGSGAETVDKRKQKKIIITAQHFLQHGKYQHHNCRFDVISAKSNADNGTLFDLNWIENAFDASTLNF